MHGGVLYVGSRHSFWYIILYKFFLSSRPLCRTHCIYLNFHWAVTGCSGVGTWKYPSMSSCLAQRNGECVCKWRRCPKQIGFFSFLGGGGVSLAEDRWLQVILIFLPQKKKTTLEYETFFIVRTLQPNILPMKEAGSLFFVHECSYFASQSDKKNSRPEYISLGKHQQKQQPPFIRPLRLEAVGWGAFHFEEASASVGAYCFHDGNLFCQSSTTSVHYRMKADR